MKSTFLPNFSAKTQAEIRKTQVSRKISCSECRVTWLKKACHRSEINYTSSVPNKLSAPICGPVPAKGNDFHDSNCHFSESPWCLLRKHGVWDLELELMWAQQPGYLDRSNLKYRQKRKKWATLVLKQQIKFLKNPPLIQFWSYCKKPYVKINQKSKTFQIG